MPRYFFHLRRGSIVETDDQGLELAGAEAAYLDAYRTIASLLPDLLAERQDPRDCAFLIVDEAGRALFDLPFTEAFGLVAERHPPRSSRIGRTLALSRAVAAEIALAAATVRHSREILSRSRGGVSTP